MFFFNFIGSSRWPKSHEGSLLQPRLIDGNTGATPLLNRSGRSAWSGSESSLNSEAEPPARVGDRALSSTNSYRQSLSSCTLDPDSFTFASGKRNSIDFCFCFFDKKMHRKKVIIHSSLTFLSTVLTYSSNCTFY